MYVNHDWEAYASKTMTMIRGCPVIQVSLGDRFCFILVDYLKYMGIYGV